MRRRLVPFLGALLSALAVAAVASAVDVHQDPVDYSSAVDVTDNDAGKLLSFKGGFLQFSEAEAKDVGAELNPIPAAKDSDGDGVPDPVAGDQCPNEAGTLPNGCNPLPPKDSDGDGVPDAQDSCPNVAGSQPDGCNPPPPPLDNDGDGVADDKDACPNVKGDQADGCPTPPPPAKCANGLDDDLDGLTDLNDPGCASAQDDDESNVIVDPPPAGDCTKTVSSATAAQDAIKAASAGEVICLADGSYGSLSLTSQKAGEVTLTAAHPGKSSVGRVSVVGGRNLTFSHLISTGFSLTKAANRIKIDSNRITTGGHGIGMYGDGNPVKTPITNVTITNNEIVGLGKDNTVSAENDLLRLQGVGNVLIEHNKLRHIYQFVSGCPSDGCGHSDMLQSFTGGYGITFRRNWITDQDGTQGFFIKDGAVKDVVVEDNLIENDPRGDGGWPLSIYAVTNGTIRRNTIRNDSGGVGARGTQNRNIVVSQNAFLGSKFTCESGSQCTVTGGTPAGISWDPAVQVYGP